MKILIVLPNDSLGGAEQYLKMITRYHQEEQVTVYFLKKLETNHWADLPDSISLEYPNKKNYLSGIFSFMRRMIFGKNKFYDRIYSSHVYVTGIIGIMISLGLLKKKQFIARESTSVFKRFTGTKLASYKFTYAIGYRHIDLLVFQTEYMKNQYLQGFPKIKQRSKTIVLENPIDISLIRSNEIMKVDYTPPKKYIVSAGRLITEKGFDILIEAFATLRADFNNLELLILGEGPEKDSLIELTKNKGIQKFVHLPGRVNNVYPYFKKASLCVVSSRIEGFPNVLLQMMSQNNKVVSTLCAGGIDRIPGIKTIPPENKNELIESIHSTLKKDLELNRITFDNYLENRDISSFMIRLEDSLPSLPKC